MDAGKCHRHRPDENKLAPSLGNLSIGKRAVVLLLAAEYREGQGLFRRATCFPELRLDRSALTSLGPARFAEGVLWSEDESLQMPCSSKPE